MARSRRKRPFCANTVRDDSEKWFKRAAHRRRRRWERANRHLAARDEREFGDPWDWPKDGKSSFDPEKHPDGMRK